MADLPRRWVCKTIQVKIDPSPYGDFSVQSQVSQGSEAATATTVASNSSGEGSLLETESKSSLERVRVFFFSGGSSDIFW
jgi:hypothetical protein